MAGAGVRDILIDGPWQHVDIAANAARFHVARGRGFAGSRRLVLLLHGFAEFWWAWRHQIPALDRAGYAVAALDLRGYGASDKTPRGYDPRSSAADIAGVVRSLGHRQAVLVGHDWGGMVAWATAAYASEQVRALAMIAAPHPLAYPWRRNLGELAFHQLPILPERRMMAARRRVRRTVAARPRRPGPGLAVGCRRPPLPRCAHALAQPALRVGVPANVRPRSAAERGPERASRVPPPGPGSAAGRARRSGPGAARRQDEGRTGSSRWPAGAGPSARRRPPAPRGRSGGLYVGALELAGHPGLSTDPFLGIPGGSLPCLSLSKGS